MEEQERKGTFFPCQFCERKFPGPETLRDHEEKVHNEFSEMQCPDCRFRCESKAFMARHRMEEHRKLFQPKLKKAGNVRKCTFECPYCDFKAPRSVDLRLHSLEEHDTEKVITCKLCDFRTSDVKHMFYHKKREHPSRLYKCPHCDYDSKVEKNLQVHISTIHLNIREFKCQICDYRAAQKVALRFHMKSAHDKIKNKFQCMYCDYESVYSYNRNSHVRRLHLVDGQFPCPQCGKLFVSQQILNNHFETKSSCKGGALKKGTKINQSMRISNLKRKDVVGKSLDKQCPVCSKLEFSTQHELFLHLRNLHKDRKDLRFCSECLFVGFARFFGRHIKMHKFRSQHQCRQCSYTVGSLKTLMSHTETCHGQRYNVDDKRIKICSLCPASFILFRSLFCHQRKMHFESDGKDLHFCSQCDFVCQSKLSFKSHSKHHGRGMGIICTFCNYSSKEAQNTKKHVQRCHDKNSTKINTQEAFKEDSKEASKEVSKEASKEVSKEVVFQKVPCTVCKETFNSVYHNFVHLREKHHEENPSVIFLCPECPFVTTEGEKSLKEHSQFHKGGFRNRCSLCTFSHDQKGQLLLHRITCHNITLVDNSVMDEISWNPFVSQKCEVKIECNFTCDTQYEMNMHKRSEHGHLVKTFLCPYCSYVAKTEHLLSLHEAAHSGSKRRYQCHSCNFATNAKSSFRRHLLNCHSVDELEWKEENSDKNVAVVKTHVKIQCKIPLCKSLFENEEDRAVHVKNSHGKKNNNMFTKRCPHCNHVAKDTEEYLSHLVEKHTARIIRCPFCPFFQSNQDILELHIKGHTSSRKHCTFSSEFQDQTESHMEIVHKQPDSSPRANKSFSCEEKPEEILSTAISNSSESVTNIAGDEFKNSALSSEENNCILPNQNVEIMNGGKIKTEQICFLEDESSAKDQVGFDTTANEEFSTCDKKIFSKRAKMEPRSSIEKFNDFDHKIRRSLDTSRPLPKAMKNYKCEICPKRFSQKQNFEAHKRIKHGEWKKGRKIETERKPSSAEELERNTDTEESCDSVENLPGNKYDLNVKQNCDDPFPEASNSLNSDQMQISLDNNSESNSNVNYIDCSFENGIGSNNMEMGDDMFTEDHVKIEHVPDLAREEEQRPLEIEIENVGEDKQRPMEFEFEKLGEEEQRPLEIEMKQLGEEDIADTDDVGDAQVYTCKWCGDEEKFSKDQMETHLGENHCLSLEEYCDMNEID